MSQNEEQPDVGEQPGLDGPPLARTSLDRAAHHRRDEDWLAQAWKTGLVVVIDIAQGGRALITGRTGDVPRLLLVSADAAPEGERLFLGIDPAGVPIFAVAAPLPEAAGAEAMTLRDIGDRLDPRDAGIFTTAAALGNWHASHLFSPRNGEPTTVTEAGWSRTDPDGRQMWPRTDPAMIVLVHDGVAGPEGRCLLGHNAAWPEVGGVRRFSCLAGYVEPGESAEAAVVREVREEVGVRVRSLQYEGSQSWPYPGSLMLGYTAVANREQAITVDPEEIDEARWFTREDIGRMIAGDYVEPASGVRMNLPMRSSIAFYLVERWLGGLDR
ncbi:NAD(+) diphosphatase [Actinoplanes friuliensis]|uniref:NAD(+) diphosphatase n=1 Tax=Actinoplanes friuliensis DSM 7358 TaxID=1246995 RepID=U5WA78_9ACTN|nr:NAD(+) diphosphatase [Actinoplanes friuliensis]AGZ45932.1 putative NUDIX hydrolase [Actinoplanes friuliensis DSM 7358]